MTAQSANIEAAQQAIVSLGLPRGQQNERSALCLLALLNLTLGKAWAVSWHERRYSAYGER